MEMDKWQVLKIAVTSELVRARGQAKLLPDENSRVAAGYIADTLTQVQAMMDAIEMKEAEDAGEPTPENN